MLNLPCHPLQGAAEFCVAEGHQIPDKSDVQMMVHSAIPCGEMHSAHMCLTSTAWLGLPALTEAPQVVSWFCDSHLVRGQSWSYLIKGYTRMIGVLSLTTA